MMEKRETRNYSGFGTTKNKFLKRVIKLKIGLSRARTSLQVRLK